MVYRFRSLFILLIIFLIATMLFSWFGMRGGGGYNSNDIEQGQKINGTIYTVFKDQIYAEVPSNGYYLMPGVTSENFHALGEGNFKDRHIGYDEKNVYAGNLILEGLKPGTLRSIGNDYYTDGGTTYYCSSITEKNPNLSVVKFVIQELLWRVGGKKPQNYWYPFVKLPEGNSAYAARFTQSIAVTGTTAFFEGKEMKDANPALLKRIPLLEDSTIKDSSKYYCSDGKNVYYKNNLLPLRYNNTISEWHINGGRAARNTYLYDSANGMLYVDGYAFRKDYAPYKIFNTQASHASHVLITCTDGIYFYDQETKSQRRAGDNVFANKNFAALSPFVFSYGQQTLVIESREVWGSRKNPGLKSYNTDINEVEGLPVGEWVKTNDLQTGSGAVWKKGDRYYYFDEYGTGQSIDHPVYEIKDLNALKLLQSGQANTDGLREMIETGKLVPPETKNLLTAKTKYKTNDNYLLMLVVGIPLVLVVIIGWILKNSKANLDPFIFKGDMFITNAVFPIKVPISEIEVVRFSAVEDMRMPGYYKGVMQIVRKNGRASRRVMFAAKVGLMPDRYDELMAYIKKLQVKLSEKGIMCTM